MSEEGESSPPVGDEAPDPKTAPEQHGQEKLHNWAADHTYQNVKKPNEFFSVRRPTANTTGFCLADIEVNDIYNTRKKIKAKNEKEEETETPANSTSTSQQSPVQTRLVD